MGDVREQNIQSAIDEVDRGMSQAKAAALHGIPPSTLSVRLRGAKPVKHSKIHAQRLSPSQEDFLADWCLNEEKSGRAPSRRQVVAFAQEILREGGDLEHLGPRWIDRFLKRNPRVHTKNSTLLDSARVYGSTRDAYEDFYGRLKYQLDSKTIRPKNMANMDEHGMQELETRAGKVIGTSLTKEALVESSDDTTWVSVIVEPLKAGDCTPVSCSQAPVFKDNGSPPRRN
jgi:4-hydroxybenzoate polyprenyltransferase